MALLLRAVGTVKSHTGNIYRKLDARNRAVALARAREVVQIEGASHTVGVSHPEEVADVVFRAIKAVE